MKEKILGKEKGRENRWALRVVNPNGLRKSNLPYVLIWVLYYAWVVVFATWWTASPQTEAVFGTQLRSLMHAANLITSAVMVMVLPREKYILSACIGGVVIVASMLLFLALPGAIAQQICALTMAIALGCVNISILMPFVFVLNNTEKFYAVVGSQVLIGSLSLFLDAGGSVMLGPQGQLWFSFVLMLCALFFILLFKAKIPAKNAVPSTPTDTVPRLGRWAYLNLALNCIFAVVGKGAGKGVLNLAVGTIGDGVLLWFNIGTLAGCFLYLLIYAFAKRCLHLSWNLTFGLMAMGLLLNAFSNNDPMFSWVFAVLFGISNAMGMINVYYLLGVIGKKYDSMRYIRLSIILIGILGGISGVLVGNMVSASQTAISSLVASLTTAGSGLLFLILSPIYAHGQYEDGWAKDCEKQEIDNRKYPILERYMLTARETQVCTLLLEGYTLRQISGILSLAYPTVNTYCTSLYRKLRINSRTELMVLLSEPVKHSEP